MIPVCLDDNDKDLGEGGYWVVGGGGGLSKNKLEFNLGVGSYVSITLLGGLVGGGGGGGTE